MSDAEMTITEVLQDPMIRLMMRADGVSLQALKTLLTDAALARNETRITVAVDRAL